MSSTNRLFNVRSEVGVVLDPVGASQPNDAAEIRRGTAGRVATLDGQVLAVIDNNTNPGLRVGLVRKLTERFALAEVITVIKDTVNVPPRPQDWQTVTSRATVGLALFGS
ncbi:MAG TPA: hypothetical protein PKV27_08165 [Ilumatobacteraceae bacterium]|nr:hypothetical protein [Ilumatobacteraceae bacterium]